MESLFRSGAGMQLYHSIAQFGQRDKAEPANHSPNSRGRTNPATSSTGCRRHAGVLAVLAGAVFSIGTYAATRVLPAAIVIDDLLEPADFIYVLNGKAEVRSRHAATVFGRGLAPLVVLPLDVAAHLASEVHGWRTTTTIIVHGLQVRAVPRASIELIPFGDGVKNTRDEARALRKYLGTHPARRVIVVTTDYHTRRAKLVLEQELAPLEVEIRMAAATDSTITQANWWRSRAGLRTYFGELGKLAVVILRR
ncbi:hypothetical protein BH23GEM6_BH23GEM6_20180 [soil metagenome]